MPLSFSSGQPQIEASGRTSLGLNIETPKSVATAPPPTSAAAALASSVPPKRPAQVMPMPSEDEQRGEGREDPPARAALGQLRLAAARPSA